MVVSLSQSNLLHTELLQDSTNANTWNDEYKHISLSNDKNEDHYIVSIKSELHIYVTIIILFIVYSLQEQNVLKL